MTSAFQDVSFGLDVGDIDGDGHPDLTVAYKEDIFYRTLGGYPGRIVIYSKLGPNRPPQITGITAEPSQPETGKDSTIAVQATDPDGDVVGIVQGEEKK